MLEKFFRLNEAGTDVKTEVRAGITTFMTMAYILFVNPVILSACGMDLKAVFIATVLASAIACFVMALLARYPIALAPGMGHNALFAFTICGMLAGIMINKGMDPAAAAAAAWPQALAAVFISGFIFLLLSLTPFRESVMNAVPPGLKLAIAAGIGLLIALVGFEYAGIVVDHPATLVSLGDITQPHVLLAIFGLLLTAALMALKVRGAILIGIVATTIIGALPFVGVVHFNAEAGFVGNILTTKAADLTPQTPAFFALDFKGLFSHGFLQVLIIIFVLFFLDLFDTVGTLVGVARQGGLLDENERLPRAREAFTADAVGTVAGALLGTSTVTSYIESTTGISEGGRTGLTSLVTGILFLLALFFGPLVALIAGGYHPDPENMSLTYYPMIAAPLILVGFMMLKNIKDLDWVDYTEAIPAFICLLIMPLTFSITEGIAWGFVSYCFLKLVTGRAKDCHWLVHLFSVLFIIWFVARQSLMG